ncbi:MAG: hypothetical protein ABJD13_05350 [Paracoccaceae bacterium]
MRSRTYPLFVFLSVFAVVLSALLGIHLVANDALVVLLPGDGCGQVLDLPLQTLIKSGLAVAYGAAAFAAISFAFIIAYGRGHALFVLAAIVNVAAFLLGGITNLRYAEHLNSCDMFFMGRDAPYLNFGAVVFLLFLIAAVFHKAFAKRST